MSRIEASMPENRAGLPAWQLVTPMPPVLDVRRAQAYYRDVLGFWIAGIAGMRDPREQ